MKLDEPPDIPPRLLGVVLLIVCGVFFSLAFSLLLTDDSHCMCIEED